MQNSLMYIVQVAPSDAQTSIVIDFFKNGNPVTVVLIVLILCMAIVIWRIAPSFFDKMRMQSEINELRKKEVTQDQKYEELLLKVDNLRDSHALEIADLNLKLLKLAQSILIIKQEDDSRK